MNKFTTNAVFAPSNNKPVVVQIQGPECVGQAGRNDDYVYRYFVWMENEDGNEVGRIYECSSYNAAQSLGNKIAADRHLEINDESQPMTGHRYY